MQELFKGPISYTSGISIFSQRYEVHHSQKLIISHQDWEVSLQKSQARNQVNADTSFLFYIFKGHIFCKNSFAII